MISWIASNIGTIAVTLVVLAAILLIVIKLVRDKRKGRSSCSCGCSSCPLNGRCGTGSKRSERQ